MNLYREQKYKECKDRGLCIRTYISPKAIVYSDIIGEGCIIMPGAYIGPYSEIGIGNVIRSNCVLSHHDKIGNFNWIADGSVFGGGAVIGNNCFLGLNSTIRNEIAIADRTFLGAKSYLGYSSECDGAYIGIPAKRFPIRLLATL